jgi:cyclase
LNDIVRKTANNIFIPITVGGGVRSVEDVHSLLRCGADKVAINTAAVARPQLIHEVSRRFGSQCMVLSVEAKRIAPGQWEVYTDNGREKTGINVLDWVQQGVELGAGEILLTSVDQEGTRKGFDVELTHAVSTLVSVPVIASGGAGTLDHLKQVVTRGHADAVAVADALHYEKLDLHEMKESLNPQPTLAASV